MNTPIKRKGLVVIQSLKSSLLQVSPTWSLFLWHSSKNWNSRKKGWPEEWEAGFAAETLGLLSLAKQKLSGNRISPSVCIRLNSTMEGEGYRCLNRKLAWGRMGINTSQMELFKRFYWERKEVVVFGHDDPQERCNISSGLLSNMWYPTVPETADMGGRKHTVQRYLLLLWRLFISAVMENPGPSWWGRYRETVHVWLCLWQIKRDTIY